MSFTTSYRANYQHQTDQHSPSFLSSSAVIGSWDMAFIAGLAGGSSNRGTTSWGAAWDATGATTFFSPESRRPLLELLPTPYMYDKNVSLFSNLYAGGLD